MKNNTREKIIIILVILIVLLLISLPVLLLLKFINENNQWIAYLILILAACLFTIAYFLRINDGTIRFDC